MNGSPAVLLMLLGGYSEDSGHFHSLTANHTIRHRLVREVYLKSMEYTLNGPNVHCVSGGDSCEHSRSEQIWRTFTLFLGDVLALLSVNVF